MSGTNVSNKGKKLSKILDFEYVCAFVCVSTVCIFLINIDFLEQKHFFIFVPYIGM